MVLENLSHTSIDNVKSEEELNEVKAKLQAHLSDLNSKFSEVSKSIDGLETKKNEEANEVQAEINEIMKQFEELQSQLQGVKSKYAKQFQELKYEKTTTKQQIDTTNMLIAAANKKSAELFNAKALKQELDKLKKDFESFEKAVWFELIKEYQKYDVAFIARAYEQNLSGVLNANVMGAGKTLETIVFLQWAAKRHIEKTGKAPRILWVTKKSLLNSSAKEIMKWNPEQPAVVVSGPKNHRENFVKLALSMSPVPVLVVNYEIINRDDFMVNLDWDFVVVDEVHKLKGGEKSKIFHRFRELLKMEKITAYGSGPNKFSLSDESPFFLPLSGSPVQNRPQDMWPILNLFRPQDFPSTRHFEKFYCTQAWDNKGKVIWKAKTEKILAVLKDQAIRQDPAMVRASWPDKTRRFIEVEMNEAQQAVYDKARNFILEGLTEKYGKGKVGMSTVIEQLIRLRQINVWPGAVSVEHPQFPGQMLTLDCDESIKVDTAFDLGMELHNDGEQFLVWSGQFNAPLEVLEERFRQEGLKVAIINGSTKNAEAIEQLFQQGELDCLLLNRAAAAEGFNFQKNPSRWPGGASNAIFLDLWFNPKANEQAEDRIWRTGQSENVTIHIIQVPNTVDDLIRYILDQKEKMIEGIVGTDEKSTLSIDDIQGLI